MRVAKPILMTVMAVTLAAYAFDCLAMSTPEAALQCCETMPCASHSAEHSQDCCKTMTSMHAPFVQPHSVHGAFFAPVFVAMLPAAHEAQGIDSSASILAAHSHATPIPDAATPSPLRI